MVQNRRSVCVPSGQKNNLGWVGGAGPDNLEVRHVPVEEVRFYVDTSGQVSFYKAAKWGTLNLGIGDHVAPEFLLMHPRKSWSAGVQSCVQNFQNDDKTSRNRAHTHSFLGVKKMG
jgi:hypothetical protein